VLPHGLAKPRAVGAKQLHNSGVVYKLNDSDTSQWIRTEKSASMDGFGRASTIRERATSVIIEYVPVSHSPDVLMENSKIE